MARRQRRPKVEFWAGLIFVALLAYALLADWWKEHSVLGWIIVGVVVALLAFLLYKSEPFRRWVFGTVKKAGESIVYGTKASAREPIRPEDRKKIMERARYRCENSGCNQHARPHIHHIDFNNSNNKLTNLIALCPNCHQEAHDGIYKVSQVRNWVHTSWSMYNRSKERSR